MTLEVLFAQAGQCRTFLLMVLLGAAMALLVHLSGRLHRRNRWVGMAADLLLAVALALVLGQVLLGSGEGLRLYGLLGLLIGGTLYAWGLAPLTGLLMRIRRPSPKGQAGKIPPQ